MLNEKGVRALAYITTLDEIKAIEGYDRVEYGRTAGWWCIINKADMMSVGDKIVYFEVDSKVPSSDERFAFLEKRHYKIKTLRMCKVISQGLIMPISAFPELEGMDVGTDVTDILKIKYAEDEDNVRKKSHDSNSKYESMKSRHKKLFKKPWAKWLMKREWGRKLMFFFFGKKSDNPRKFPSFISKTDEERIENQPWRIGDGIEYTVTEKLDGTSCTYALERTKKGKYEFYVCSRNVRMKDINQECYHDHNIYWSLALKYDIENKLKAYLEQSPNETWVAIQGEGVGNVQGNPLKLEEDDLYVFNFIDSSGGRWPSYNGKALIEMWGMKWVPIIGTMKLPDTMEELKKITTGPSVVNPNVMREGYVFRSLDGRDSFKSVSNDYLLARHSK